MKSRTIDLTRAALIAALYVVLTIIANIAGLASGPIQIRLSEALTILPVFTIVAIPGLTIGCIVANVMTGCALWDVIFGSMATLLGAIGTYCFARKKPVIGPVFPIICNAIIVPFVLQYVYNFEGSYWYFFATVGIGEIISCGILGLILYKALKKTKIFS